MSTPSASSARRARSPLFDDPIFRRFFGEGVRPGGATAQSLGSGVIVDPSGLVVTNNHVIEDMNEVKVALADRREFPADILLRDSRSDLAILRIKAAKDATFPVLQLGDSDAIQVGDLALAIGDPFGVGQTVTQGIVSALARTETGISDYGFFIQTDAAINPGNSGGALVDMQRAADRHQCGDCVAIGRLGRHRLRHSGQYGEKRPGHRQGAAARKSTGPGSARPCRISTATSPIPSGWSGRPALWSPRSIRAVRRRKAG